MRRLGILIMAACLLVATACSSSPSAPAPAPTVTVTATATATATATVTETPPPPASTAAKPLKLGASFRTSIAKVTVLKFAKAVKVGDGSRIRTILVKSCVTQLTSDTPDGVGFSWDPWTLIDTQSGRYEPASDRWDHLGAAYPDDSDDLHQPGECVKGIIQFDPSKKKTALVRYHNSAGETATWKV